MASISRLPVKVQASQNIRTLAPMRSTSLLWIDDAITVPWMSWDSSEFRNALLIDIDHADALEKWQDLPPHIRPHLVLDAWSGRGHAILPLASPVLLSGKGRDGPKILADLAGRLLAAALGGSLLPVRSVVKNPWGTIENLSGHLPRIGPSPAFRELHDLTTARGLVWHTIVGHGPVELRTIVDALAGEYWHEPAAQAVTFRRNGKKRGTPNPLGRNTIMFDRVRWWAYDREEKDLSEILSEAVRVNAEFSYPLPPAEVMATSRSIAKFMANRFRPRHGMSEAINRGRDAGLIDESMSLSVRQSISSQSTGQARVQKTLAKVLNSIQSLSQLEIIPSQSAISNHSKISLRTIKRVWNLPVSFGALSGSVRKDGQGKGGTLTLKEYCSELSTRIQKKKEEAQKIRIYEEMTERMMRRGGKPEDVPPRGPGASPELTSAHNAALAARRDAIRRQERRAERGEQKARREERLALFQKWAQAGDREGFEAFYSSEIARWDALEMLIDPEEREELRTHNIRKFTYLKRVRQEWNRARQGGLRRRNGFRRTPDFIDERAREICVPRMIEDRSYVISAGKNE